MILAISATGPTHQSTLEPRFGRAPHFLLFDTDTNTYTHLDNTSAAAEAHGAGPLTAQRVAEAGAQVVITGNGPGGNAARVLQAADIRVVLFEDNLSVAEAVERYLRSV